MTKLGKALTAAAMVAALTGTQVMAADSLSLAPGKPAGVQKAQGREGLPLIPILGAVAIIVVVAAVVGSQKGSGGGGACGTSCSAPTSTRQ
jgi:hypothetical protein